MFILKEISPEYSLEGLMLKLKLQYFGHLMWRTDSLEKTLMLGKNEGGRRRGRQRMRWLDGICPTWWTWVWASSGSWWWPGTGQGLACCSPWSQTWLSNWTELNWTELKWLSMQHAYIRENEHPQVKPQKMGAQRNFKEPPGVFSLLNGLMKSWTQRRYVIYLRHTISPWSWNGNPYLLNNHCLSCLQK